MTAGETREEALENITDAMRDWVEARLESGLDIPEPMAAYSGKVLLRLPRDVHRAAEMRAGREGTSLNTWLATAIARQLGPTVAVGPRARATGHVSTKKFGARR